MNVPGNVQHQAQGGLRDDRPAGRLGRGHQRARHHPGDRFKGGSYQCIDFARSSGGRKPTYPADKPGGVVLRGVRQGRDHLGGAAAAKGGTDAPASLNHRAAQGDLHLHGHQLGAGRRQGRRDQGLPAAARLGNLSTWEKFMGITTLGACVSQAPEENEGTYAGFNNPNAIFICSIGAYVAQKYHEAACGKTPTKTQNQFGCNLTGFTVPEKINGVNPLSSGKVPTINTSFPISYWRTVYNVVKYWTGTKDHLSPKDEHIFGARSEKGYICSNAGAQTLIKDYGFVATGLCGSTT